MNKKIYYYNQKYPEFGIKDFIVKDELKLIGNGIEILEFLVTDYNLEQEKIEENDCWISAHSTYDDSEILEHDRSIGGKCILSYNYEKLQRELRKQLKIKEKELEKKLTMIKEAIKDE